ncbi:copper resistance D family protein [Psychrobacillus psychrodurans]|uniref:copper resistance D family protein n=1 Tax=Psychrobacillus psychrodurans TaxID=126157 RepID=UPI0008F21461|nr:CopD family protein [Psychrobacillus psychrodurans]MCZ8539822.1 CopD family protein [Psychrobacillus psychrodurans]SFM91997.1 putative copper resistance protein D [Psychrobacillus psychrodurans]
MIFILTTISEALLYVCFALLMGSYIISLFPDDLIPTIVVPRKVKLFAVIGIALFSFVPLISLIIYLYEDYGLLDSLQSILLTFEVGKSWLFMFIVTVFLGLYILFFHEKKSAYYSIVGILLVFVAIIGVSWSSHANSIESLKGLITHFLHFASVVIWVGILFVVAWFSKNTNNWLSFLKWFHITALYCFGIVIITGLSLMSFSTPLDAYSDTWMISYGQSLLIKHLLIIPLIGYAFINGVLMKKRLLKNKNFDARPWTKAEFFILLLIFAATGAMSQQSPPHNLFETINNEGFSSLILLFHDVIAFSDITVQMVFNTEGVILLCISTIFLVITLFSFVKKQPAIFGFIMSLFVVIAAYFGLMLSIQII